MATTQKWALNSDQLEMWVRDDGLTGHGTPAIMEDPRWKKLADAPKAKEDAVSVVAPIVTVMTENDTLPGETPIPSPFVNDEIALVEDLSVGDAFIPAKNKKKR